MFFSSLQKQNHRISTCTIQIQFLSSHPTSLRSSLILPFLLCKENVIAQSAVGWATGVRFPVGISLFSIESTPAVGPTQPHIPWVRRGLSRRLSGRGVKVAIPFHLVPRSRMRGAIPPVPHMSSRRGAQLRTEANSPPIHKYLPSTLTNIVCSII